MIYFQLNNLKKDIAQLQKKKEKKQQKNINVDMEKIQKRKIQKEKTIGTLYMIEEILAEQTITQTEQKALDNVFKLFTTHKRDYFTAEDITRVLKLLEYPLPKTKIDLMIWEVDNNLDKQVDKKEFEFMYKRNIYDKNGQEPKSLFHVVQFLMYCKENSYRITVEDTLELLFVRLGREQLDQEIRALFGEEEKNENGQEKQICFAEYLEKINKRAVEQRKERQKEINQLISMPSKRKHDESVEM